MPDHISIKDRTALILSCGACHHVWPALWLPCKVDALSAVTKKGVCPACRRPAKIASLADEKRGDFTRWREQLLLNLAMADKVIAKHADGSAQPTTVEFGCVGGPGD